MRGIPYSSPFYQRQAECGYREGAGGRGRRAVITEARKDRTRTKTKTGSCVGVRLAGRLTMRVVGLAPKLTGPIANRRWWRGWPLDYRRCCCCCWRSLWA